ncbi:MAG: hypothetical protein GY753_09660 [Gammaproteobacteria bacterium]|nr:hypothetical protein [Gammaproteobacteria bacterium]
MITETEWEKGDFTAVQVGQIHKPTELQKAMFLGMVFGGSRIIDEDGVEYIKVSGDTRSLVRCRDGIIIMPSMLRYPVAIDKPRP